MERIELTEDDLRELEYLAGAEGVSEAVIRQRVSRGLAGLRRRMRGDA